MGMCYPKPIPSNQEVHDSLSLLYARIYILQRETLTATTGGFDPLGQTQRRQAGIDLKELHDHLDKIKVICKRLGINIE